MKTPKRIRDYILKNSDEVLHTTLNPNGPGAVRIHLIPPKPQGDMIHSSVAIINGQDIIPVNVSFSILLTEFIREVNKYDGRSVSDEDVAEIISETVRRVRKVFPLISGKRLKEDLYFIMETFTKLAYGEPVDERVGYMSLSEYAPYMRAPHRFDIMVSAMTKNGQWHCNQKCMHCYAAGQPQSEEAELSTGEWKQILDKLRAIGVPQVTFTGGEPTMREDLFELIAHAKWFVSRLNTNGIKLTKEYCEGLKKAELDSMQITFYSSDREIHNKLVGAMQYDATVSGIENALAAGLNVSINTPLCTLNRDYVNTLAFLKSKGIRYVTCSGLITTGNAMKADSENLQLSNEEVREILSSAVSYCYSNDMEISFTSPGFLPEEFFEKAGLTMPACGACLSNMAITPGGHVVPCQSWLSGEVLGDILKDDWNDIWNSESCKKHRDYSAEMTGFCPLRRNGNEK